MIHNDGVLFIMSRFLDNGYGVFFVTQEQWEKIEKEKRFRINGYDVTRFIKEPGMRLKIFLL